MDEARLIHHLHIYICKENVRTINMYTIKKKDLLKFVHCFPAFISYLIYTLGVCYLINVSEYILRSDMHKVNYYKYFAF